MSIRVVSRTPTGDDFHPVGHISLDTINPELKAKGVTLDLPSKDVYWIKSFYVSTALRSQHIGGAAMAAAESIAVSKPLCAQTLVLDTLYKGDQMREDLAKAHWGAVPKVNCTPCALVCASSELSTDETIHSSATKSGMNEWATNLSRLFINITENRI